MKRNPSLTCDRSLSSLFSLVVFLGCGDSDGSNGSTDTQATDTQATDTDTTEGTAGTVGGTSTDGTGATDTDAATGTTGGSSGTTDGGTTAETTGTGSTDGSTGTGGGACEDMPACGDCFACAAEDAGYCTAEKAACVGDTDCTALATCVAGCPPVGDSGFEACHDDCVDGMAGEDLFKELGACLACTTCNCGANDHPEC